jgi:hypothetical protein
MTTTLKLNTDLYSIMPKPSIYNTQLYSNNFIVKHNNYNIKFRNNIEYHNIKCWKSNCIFQYYIQNSNDANIIYSLDFNINKDDKENTFIKIDNLYTNNEYYDIKYYDYYEKPIYKLLTNQENKLIRESLINFIENWAIKENINKIIIDIHSNLERYNYELKDLGFIPTNRCCLLNPYWIEAEKIITKV